MRTPPFLLPFPRFNFLLTFQVPGRISTTPLFFRFYFFFVPSRTICPGLLPLFFSLLLARIDLTLSFVFEGGGTLAFSVTSPARFPQARFLPSSHRLLPPQTPFRTYRSRFLVKCFFPQRQNSSPYSPPFLKKARPLETRHSFPLYLHERVFQNFRS